MNNKMYETVLYAIKEREEWMNVYFACEEGFSDSKKYMPRLPVKSIYLDYH